MTHPPSPFSEDQRDALQEIQNIAMGQAGRSLAEVFGTFILLSIPQIHVVSPQQINDVLADIIGDIEVSAVRQCFSGTIRGESFVIFKKQDYKLLSEMLDHPGDVMSDTENELLLDISNILIGAFHSCVREVLRIDISASPPSLIAKSQNIRRLTLAEKTSLTNFVMIEIVFEIDQKGFCCHLAQLMPDESIEMLKESLDVFLTEF